MPVKSNCSDCPFNYSSITYDHHRQSKTSVLGGVSLNLETDGNHLVFGQENTVDGTILVQRVTCEQMHCHAKVGVPGSTFLDDSL